MPVLGKIRRSLRIKKKNRSKVAKNCSEEGVSDRIEKTSNRASLNNKESKQNEQTKNRDRARKKRRTRNLLQEGPPLPLEDVPGDVFATIASFLTASDALALSFTSKKLRNEVNLSVIDPGLKLYDQERWNGDYHTGDTPRRGREIPNLFGNKTHTIRLQCDLVDQGWGNRKGNVYIVADNSEHYDPGKGFQNRNVVATSRLADHWLVSVGLSFTPKLGERYHLWYKVGGGGGHTLHISNAMVTYLVHDDERYSLKRASAFLNSTGLLGAAPHQTSNLFCQSIVSVVAKSLEDTITRGGTPDPSVIDIFQSRGLGNFGVDGLRAVRLVLDEFKKHQEKETATNLERLAVAFSDY